MPAMSANVAPLVVVSNTFEAYANFLNRADQHTYASLAQSIQVAGERSLLWEGDRKLVFTAGSVAHLDYLNRSLGYCETRCASPKQPTQSLSLDILREPALIQQIVDFAGADRTVQLIAYATTPEFLKLARVLETEHGLTVQLPESPDPVNLWLRDYIETKAGFRSMAQRWILEAQLGAQLVEGYVAQTLEEAAAIAYWFCTRGYLSVVKANTGFLGIGHTLIDPSAFSSASEILDKLRHNPFLQQDLIIVERWLASRRQLSPSVEFVVPRLSEGEPALTQVCTQIFRTVGDYAGELVSRELQQEAWYAPLVASGMFIAHQLQAMGYVGHFDVDSIVSDEGTLYLIEVNARRTGGTHIHELATFLLGANYLQDRVLLSQTSADSGSVLELGTLLKRISDLLYVPMSLTESPSSGVILTHTAALSRRCFGYVIVAATADEASALQQTLTKRLL